MMLKKILIACCLIMLTSCASVDHIPLTNENNHIKSVYINPQIKKPDNMYEFASGAEFGMAFGAIGGLVSGAANASSADTLQGFVEKNKIDIRQIVYKQWKNEIQDKSKFKLSDQPNEVTLITEIVAYGISIPHGFSTDYVPILTLNAKLIRNNQIIWQDSGRTLPLTSDMPRYKMDQIMHDPNALRIMWEKASKKIIDDMIIDINSSH